MTFSTSSPIATSSSNSSISTPCTLTFMTEKAYNQEVKGVIARTRNAIQGMNEASEVEVAARKAKEDEANKKNEARKEAAQARTDKVQARQEKELARSEKLQARENKKKALRSADSKKRTIGALVTNSQQKTANTLAQAADLLEDIDWDEISSLTPASKSGPTAIKTEGVRAKQISPQDARPAPTNRFVKA